MKDSIKQEIEKVIDQPSGQTSEMDRREALIKLGKVALYVSPVTTTLLMSTCATAQSVCGDPGQPPCPPPWTPP